jgi:ElaB/YqjD/DUF883 family membrane-anchored ribosome-binding protein
MATTTNRNDKNQKGENMENQASSVMDTARNVAENVKDRAKQAGDFVRDKADNAASSAGKGMENLASTIRDKGPREGILGQATSGVAGALDSTGRYLDEQGVSGMVDDLTGLIKNHPVPAVLIGIGLGFLLARLTTSSRS